MGWKLIKKVRSKLVKTAAAAPVETPEQKDLRLASAITDSGRKTDIVNSTTNKPVESVSSATAENEENLGMYINDLRNRRRKRGAPMPENAPTLSTTGALGG